VLRDFPKIQKGLLSAFPATIRAELKMRLSEVDRVLAGFVRGQLTVSMLMAILYSFGLSLTGIDLPVVIGVLTGVAIVVPIVGVLSMATVSTIMAIAKFGIIDPDFVLKINPHVLGVI